MISPCAYINPQAFHHIYSPLSSWGGKVMDRLFEHLAPSQSQAMTAPQARGHIRISPVQPPLHSRVVYKVRPGCSGFYSVESWTPLSTWTPSASTQSLGGAARPPWSHLCSKAEQVQLPQPVVKGRTFHTPVVSVGSPKLLPPYWCLSCAWVTKLGTVPRHDLMRTEYRSIVFPWICCLCPCSYSSGCCWSFCSQCPRGPMLIFTSQQDPQDLFCRAALQVSSA